MNWKIPKMDRLTIQQILRKATPVNKASKKMKEQKVNKLFSLNEPRNSSKTDKDNRCI